MPMNNDELVTKCSQLEKANEELKNRKDNYYVKTLDQEAQISDLIYENEELKLKYEAVKQMNRSLLEGIGEDVLKFSQEYIEKEQTKKIKHENNKLRKQNERLKEKLREVEDYPHFFKLSGKCFFDEARTCNYFNDFVEARQALEEIREIASWHISKQDSEDVQNDMEDILDKINKALESEGE